VITPEDFMGDVIGDLNSRRGQIQAMDERAGARAVTAVVPLSEMFGYVGDLRSRTQGRASYSMQFDSYAEVPSNVAKEIIAKAHGEQAPDQHLPVSRPVLTTTRQWLRPSSSGPSRTSTSAPSVTLTMARRR